MRFLFLHNLYPIKTLQFQIKEVLALISNQSELHCPDFKSAQCPPDLDGRKGLISNEALELL